MKPPTRRIARTLFVPVALGVTALAAACGNGPGGPGDASADATEVADAMPCRDVLEDDGGVRYRLCPSRVNPDCLRLEYPDGAVLDPTFC